MSRQPNVAPVIIKRKKIVKSSGHHGGAWKVAYADFVTAMMAFFLMMWLLGATTESQRRGLADYFNPSIPVHRISSGGDGMFGGTDIERRDQLGPESPPTTDADSDSDMQAEAESFENITQQLSGLGGESPVLDQALRHIITRQTDEGLVLELFDLPGMPLFDGDSDEPTAVMRQISSILTQVFSIVVNDLAIEGHTRSYTVVQASDPRWALSSARADQVRRMLGESGFDPARVARVTGHADRRPAVSNPMAVRNNRLELILLRN
ncbi:flagellar motor protein MotB [Pararhodobacter oceanensis]|uniref:flagellar motor protein MotB n=1 Tax=Pararhodobacter oceanensis TaxID=2172121 RepID=UPI003A94CA7A